jgi:hypothetical protein
LLVAYYIIQNSTGRSERMIGDRTDLWRSVHTHNIQSTRVFSVNVRTLLSPIFGGIWRPQTKTKIRFCGQNL